MRLFNVDHNPDGTIEKWYSEPDGKIHRKIIQPNMAGFLDAAKAQAEYAKGKNYYKIGSVPIVVAKQWERECGHGINSKEWLEYAKKKLMDPDYRDLSTGIKV